VRRPGILQNQGHGDYCVLRDQILWHTKQTSHALLFADLTTAPTDHHRIYNNIFYTSDGRYTANNYNAIVMTLNVATSLDDVVIANNTFVDIPWAAISINITPNTEPLTNIEIKNNIIYNTQSRSGTGQSTIDLDDGDYDETDVVISKNTVHDGPSGDDNIRFDAVGYDDIDA